MTETERKLEYLQSMVIAINFVLVQICRTDHGIRNNVITGIDDLLSHPDKMLDLPDCSRKFLEQARDALLAAPETPVVWKPDAGS